MDVTFNLSSVDPISHFFRSYATLPLYAESMKDFMNARADAIQLAMSDALTYAEGDGGDFSDNSLSIPVKREGDSGEAVHVMRVPLYSIASALDAEEMDEIVPGYDVSGSLVELKAGDVYNGVISAYRSAVLNAEIYNEVSIKGMSGSSLSTSDVITRLSSRLDGDSIRSIGSELDSLVGKADGVSVLYRICFGYNSPSSNGEFNFDQYSSINPFAAAIVEYKNTVVGFFDGVWKGIAKIGETIRAIGDAIGSLVTWLITQVARALTVDYEVNERSICRNVDVPFISAMGSIANIKSLLSAVSQQSSQTSTVKVDGIDRQYRLTMTSKLQAVQEYFDDMVAWALPGDQTMISFPVGSWICEVLRDGSNDSTLYFRAYATSNVCPAIELNFDYSTANNSLSSNFYWSTLGNGLTSSDVTNDQIGSLVKQINNFPGNINLSRFWPIDFTCGQLPNFTKGQTVSWSSITTDYGAASLVDSIRYKNQVITEEPNDVSFAIVAMLYTLCLIYATQSDADPSDICPKLFSAVIQGSEGAVNLSSPTRNELDALWIPFFRDSVVDGWIHVQTDGERIAEARVAIVSIIAAAASITALIGSRRVRHNVAVKLAHREQLMLNAKKIMLANPTVENTKAYLKAVRKYNKTTRTASFLGISYNPSSQIWGYSNTPSTPADIDQVIKLIAG